MITPEIVHFFHNQRFTIISTIDRNGYPHNSCKGIVEIDEDGKVYLLDLYMAKTYENLRGNPHISITGIDEHKFAGYCLQGKARIVTKNKLSRRILKLWENKITSRITHRLLRNMKGEKGHASHPEALLPKPAYLIEVDVKDVIDLRPPNLRQGG